MISGWNQTSSSVYWIQMKINFKNDILKERLAYLLRGKNSVLSQTIIYARNHQDTFKWSSPSWNVTQWNNSHMKKIKQYLRESMDRKSEPA
jgi:hypothetical protein